MQCICFRQFKLLRFHAFRRVNRILWRLCREFREVHDLSNLPQWYQIRQFQPPLLSRPTRSQRSSSFPQRCSVVPVQEWEYWWLSWASEVLFRIWTLTQTQLYYWSHPYSSDRPIVSCWRQQQRRSIKSLDHSVHQLWSCLGCSKCECWGT